MKICQNDLLLADVIKVSCSGDTNDDVRVCFLIQTSQHERQTLPLAARVGSCRRFDTITERVDQPQRQTAQHAWVHEEREVGALGENDDAMSAQGLDVLLVNDGRALSNDGAVEGH